MQQVKIAHWYQPDFGPERFMGSGAVVSDDDPAVSRNPAYFMQLDPQPPEPAADPPRRDPRRRRGG